MSDKVEAKKKEMETLDDVAKSARHVDRRRTAAAEKMLPVERKAMRAISEHVGTGDPAFDEKYPRIDVKAALESMRAQEGVPFPVPRFALFNVQGDGRFYIEARRERWAWYDGRDVRIIGWGPESGPGALFAPATKILAERCKKVMRNKALLRTAVVVAPLTLAAAACALAGLLAGVVGFLTANLFGIIAYTYPADEREESISASFDGVIPDATRQKVQAAGAAAVRLCLFGDGAGEQKTSIFLLCEVEAWAHEGRDVPLLQVDPLVVAYVKGAWYLIDKFDLTPAEDYIAREFSS